MVRCNDSGTPGSYYPCRASLTDTQLSHARCRRLPPLPACLAAIRRSAPGTADQLDEAKRWAVGEAPAQQGQRDVIDRDAGARAALRRASVRVAVHGGGDLEAVYGFFQAAGAEEWEDLLR